MGHLARMVRLNKAGNVRVRLSNTQTRRRNNCCHGKAVRITYFSTYYIFQYVLYTFNSTQCVPLSTSVR